MCNFEKSSLQNVFSPFHCFFGLLSFSHLSILQPTFFFPEEKHLLIPLTFELWRKYLTWKLFTSFNLFLIFSFVNNFDILFYFFYFQIFLITVQQKNWPIFVLVPVVLIGQETSRWVVLGWNRKFYNIQ